MSVQLHSTVLPVDPVISVPGGADMFGTFECLSTPYVKDAASDNCAPCATTGSFKIPRSIPTVAGIPAGDNSIEMGSTNSIERTIPSTHTWLTYWCAYGVFHFGEILTDRLVW